MRHVMKILSVLLTVGAGPVAAQELIGSYTAVIGTEDLYNSNGARLTEPWQVLRQDRANFHRFGIRQPGDEWDPFFGDIDNRAAMERMIMRGRIDPGARGRLMQGNTTITVRIYGRAGRGDFVEVTVAGSAPGAAGSTGPDALIGSYTAVIGTDDLYNSNGARLTEPWQVLRQDRANYHRFGLRQPGDEWDPFFGDIDNRAAMERMIMQGQIGPAARRALMQGGATVTVRIYGRGNAGTRVEVSVVR